jgi:hypothetical protein
MDARSLLFSPDRLDNERALLFRPGSVDEGGLRPALKPLALPAGDSSRARNSSFKRPFRHQAREWARLH